LARPSSLLSLLVGTRRILMWFPFLLSRFINLYVWQTNSWPDCCRRFLIEQHLLYQRNCSNLAVFFETTISPHAVTT
jgi:hypothetical protein